MTNIKYTKNDQGQTVIDFERTGNNIDDYQKELQLITVRLNEITEDVKKDKNKKGEYQIEFRTLEKRLKFLIGALNDEVDNIMSNVPEDDDDI